MTDTLTIKLTRAEKAAAKRLVGLHDWQIGTAKTNPYDRCRETICRDDEEAILWAVLRAIQKAGAKPVKTAPQGVATADYVSDDEADAVLDPAINAIQKMIAKRKGGAK